LPIPILFEKKAQLPFKKLCQFKGNDHAVKLEFFDLEGVSAAESDSSIWQTLKTKQCTIIYTKLFYI